MGYCPQSFSGGGLYLNVNWLLWSVYDGLLWYVFNRLLWYMGHTSMCQFHTGLSRFLAAVGYYRKLWCINKIDYNLHHWDWYMGHTSMCQFHTGDDHFLAVVGSYRKWWCFNKIYCHVHHWAWYMGYTSMSQFHTGLSRFLAVAGYYRKWWCINKSIIIFIIELGIWVILACPNFIRVWDVFWRWLVTVENDDVSTNLL